MNLSQMLEIVKPQAGKGLFPIHRSGILVAQRCPRQWFLQYAAQPHQLGICPEPPPAGFLGGIVPAWKYMALQTGSAVHAGMEVLVREAVVSGKVGDIPAAMEVAMEMIRQTPGYVGEDPAFFEYYRREQEYLSGALVWLFGRRVLPLLLENYDFIAAEKEMSCELPGGLLLQGRTDAVLMERASLTGLPVLGSWKTCAAFSESAKNSIYTDDQGLSEGFLHAMESVAQGIFPHENARDLETSPPNPLQMARATLMVYLVKGIRRKDKDSGWKKTTSPLIRPYRSPSGTDFTPKYKAGWTAIPIWETRYTLHAWLEFLLQNHLEELDKLWHVLGPVTRSWADMQEWVETASAEMRRMHAAASLVKDLDDPFLRTALPKRRQFCQNYSAPCATIPICHNGLRDPLMNGFVWREPHHPIEDEEDMAEAA